MLQKANFDFLRRLNLSKDTFALSTRMLRLSEKFGRNRAQIWYLKHCKANNTFPKTVEHLKLPAMFQHTYGRMDKATIQIKGLIVSKMIRHLYCISSQQLKQLYSLNDTLKEQAPSQASQIIDTSKTIFIRSKQANKGRLSRRIARPTHPTSQESNNTTPPTNASATTTTSPTNTERPPVTDLSETLTATEIDLLAKGPKFAIKAKTNDSTTLNIKSSLCKLAYQARWREYLQTRHHREQTPQQIPKYPRNDDLHKPPPGSAELEHKLRTASIHVQKIIKSRRFAQSHSNLTPTECKTIRSLKQKDLVFLPSDKGGEFCVVDQERYDNAALNHLSDTSVYRTSRITKPQTIERKINQTWRNIAEMADIPDYITRSYITNNSNMPRFYHLIKTHKQGTDLKIRPIVSSTGGPGYKISYLVCQILNPLLSDVPAHLSSSMELINHLKTLPTTTLQEYNYPFSLDVTALYTSVPPLEAIDNAFNRLTERKELCRPLKPQDIKDLLLVVLQNCVFRFKDKFYTQVSGLPMGNAMSGILAILFMDTLEKQTLRNLTDINLLMALYKRYVDDSLALAKNRQEAEAIHSALNAAHPAINFEIELPTDNNSISLLDFTVQVERDGQVNIDFYQKKAKANLLPHYRSALPTNAKRNILNNEIKRRKERCSTPEQAEKHLQDFTNTMKQNGYPANFIGQQTNRRKTRNRQTHNTQPTSQDYMYFDFPYIDDTTDRQVKKIFRDLDLPVRLYRRSHTLRNALNKTPPQDECNMKDCLLKNEQCLIKNCVYKLTCSKCHEVYIGSTFRTFHARFKEHMTSNNSSVSAHRKQCRSSFSSKIIAREHDPVKLRFKEALLIQKHNASINSRAEREELQHLIV